MKILWTSPLIPRDPLVWRKDLPADVKAKIKGFIIGYGKDDREKAILKGMQQIARLPRVLATRSSSPSASSSSPRTATRSRATPRCRADEKAAKIKAIDAKLADLAKLAK